MKETKVYIPARQTNIDILRIVMMLWIIMFHFADHGLVDMSVAELNINWCILAFARMGGGLGNCIFVLISGYMLVDKQFTLRRIIKLWLEVWFYSVTIGCICYIFGITEFTIFSFIKMFLPVTFLEYWYMSAYVVLFLLTPYINYLIYKLNKKQHLFFCILLFLVFSFMPTFTNTKWLTGTNNLPIFVTLYVIGAYIKLYNLKLNKVIGGVILIICIIGCWFSEIILKLIGVVPFYFVWDMYKSPIVLTSIVFFLVFKNIDIKENPFIQKISASIFGVYLIHIGRLQNFLFQDIINNEETYNSWLLPLQMISCSLIIFIVCILLDRLRIYLFEKRVLNRINQFIVKLDVLVKSFFPMIDFEKNDDF